VTDFSVLDLGNAATVVLTGATVADFTLTFFTGDCIGEDFGGATGAAVVVAAGSGFFCAAELFDFCANETDDRGVTLVDARGVVFIDGGGGGGGAGLFAATTGLFAIGFRIALAVEGLRVDAGAGFATTARATGLADAGLDVAGVFAACSSFAMSFFRRFRYASRRRASAFSFSVLAGDFATAPESALALSCFGRVVSPATPGLGCCCVATTRVDPVDARTRALCALAGRFTNADRGGAGDDRVVPALPGRDAERGSVPDELIRARFRSVRTSSSFTRLSRCNAIFSF
jgi:hypothetical protein